MTVSTILSTKSEKLLIGLLIGKEKEKMKKYYDLSKGTEVEISKGLKWGIWYDENNQYTMIFDDNNEFIGMELDDYNKLKPIEKNNITDWEVGTWDSWVLESDNSIFGIYGAEIFDNYKDLKKKINNSVGCKDFYDRYLEDELGNYLSVEGSNSGGFDVEVEFKKFHIEQESYLIDEQNEEWKSIYILFELE